MDITNNEQYTLNPRDRRPGEYKVRDNVIVLGGRPGRMIFLAFDLGTNLSDTIPLGSTGY